MKKLYFITVFIIIDLLLSQLFLLKFLENDLIKANKDSLNLNLIYSLSQLKHFQKLDHF